MRFPILVLTLLSLTSFLLHCGSSQNQTTTEQSSASDSSNQDISSTTDDIVTSDTTTTIDTSSDAGTSTADTETESTDSSPAGTDTVVDDSSSASSDNTGVDTAASDTVDSGSTSSDTPPTTTLCDNDFSLATSGVDITSGLHGHTEPSGNLWHSQRNTLFVVDDGGYLLETDADGTFINEWHTGNDLEGITVADPTSNFVYLGVERLSSNSHVAIIEYNISTGSATRTFDLSTWMHPTNANKGLEALTFVPDSTNSEGGTFYAALQETGTVYVFRLPIVSSTTSTTVTNITSFTPVSGWTDLSDMDYDATDGVIYAIYDGQNTMISMTPSGTVLDSWSLPLDGQEGIALNRNSCEWFIADDTTGHLWRY